MTTESEMQRQIGSLMWVNGMNVSSLEDEGVISDHIGLLIKAKDESEFQIVIQANDKIKEENYDSICKVCHCRYKKESGNDLCDDCLNSQESWKDYV